ncbi:unnamed protein product [Euphydryas editha]|uniref:Uncharacterized protein n=1 Tax=Euphydryas editha TaxID=104508 RepID=A0AAU9UPG6_EUPED|nr:unnamed protein product [Euphydryas editha]
MKILHTIRDTPPNPRGLSALSPSFENCYVAYLGSSAAGEVQIFDAAHLVFKKITKVDHLSFNSNGGWFAHNYMQFFTCPIRELMPKLIVYIKYKKGTEICNYSYSNTVLAVKLNRFRLIVCFQ